MVAPKFHEVICPITCSFAFVGAGCSPGTIVNNSNVQVDNSVEQCFQIKPLSQLVHNNVILLEAELSAVKSTGYCGCKSATLSYYVTTHPVGPSSRPEEYGVFSSLRHGKYTFVLGRTGTPENNKTYTLSIQCASPD